MINKTISLFITVMLISVLTGCGGEAPECPPYQGTPGSMIHVANPDGSYTYHTVPQSGELQLPCGGSVTILTQLSQ
jgi:hypothetical protein